MTIDETARKKIVAALLSARDNFEGSDAKFASSYNISASVFNRLKKGETDRLMRDAVWISVARKLGVVLGDEPELLTADTAVFQYITSQLTLCKSESISAMYCDATETGKSHSAKWFVANNKNSVYVDCSLHKSKQKLIRHIAQSLGIDFMGRYEDVFADLVYLLKVIYKPIVILDEFGDLDYSAFMEVKALWNGTEGACAWYAMGADGLQKKIESGRINRRVGFAEIYSRYGSKFNRVTPLVPEEQKEFWMEEALAIIDVNLPIIAPQDRQKMLIKSNGSTRALRNQILKLKRKMNEHATSDHTAIAV